MKKHLTVAFLGFSILYLASLSYPNSLSWLLKIIPIGVLALAVIKHSNQTAKPFLLLALAFSATGDTLLELDLFIAGIAAFLLAQLSYATLFVRHWQGLAHRWPMSSALIIYVFVMAFWLWPNLGDMQIPVLAYLIAIAFMGLMAIQSHYPVRCAVLGALVFISSDSLIAIDRFIHPIPLRSYWIMITYYAAQWMLIAGCLRRTDR
ncbi:MAG: lysoplasmalogenase [Reinekea sp.]|nr:lysoplasmalogenase [Reinekea sp.]